MVALIRELYDHHFWANGKLWQCIDAIDDKQFNRPLEYSVGSIANQIHHITYWEYFWFASISAGRAIERSPDFEREKLQTRSGIRAFAKRTEALEREVIGELQLEDMSCELNLQNYSISYQHIFMQLYGHAIDHRAQILAALAGMSAPTFEQTFLFYLRERNA